jgi:hypothetical protein
MRAGAHHLLLAERRVNHPGNRTRANRTRPTTSINVCSHDHPPAAASVAGRGVGLACSASAALDSTQLGAEAGQDADVDPADPAVLEALPEALVPPEVAELPDWDPLTVTETPDAAAGDPGVTGVETAAAPPVPFVHWVGPCLSQAGG